MENVFIIDPARCTGCQACAECSTHRGTSMIHLEYVNRPETVRVRKADETEAAKAGAV